MFANFFMLLKKHYCILGIVMMLFSPQLFSQDKRVSGTVTDAANATGLPGVTVNVKGTKLTTQTDANGKYSIATGSGKALVFFFCGL